MTHKNTNRTGDDVRNEIMAFITQYLNEHLYPPTIREIGKGVGLSSTSTVHHHIHTLIKEHRLETDVTPEKSISRALRIPGYKLVKTSSQTQNEH